MAIEPTIDVQAEQTPRGLVAHIAGSAGVDQIDELDRQLRLLAVLRPELVVLDLAQVPFVSSMALGSLVRFRNEISTAGGRVAIVGLRQNVADVFKQTGLHKIFSVHPTVDAAFDARPA